MTRKYVRSKNLTINIVAQDKSDFRWPHEVGVWCQDVEVVRKLLVSSVTFHLWAVTLCEVTCTGRFGPAQARTLAQQLTAKFKCQSDSWADLKEIWATFTPSGQQESLSLLYISLKHFSKL